MFDPYSKISSLIAFTVRQSYPITADVRQPWTNYVNNGNKHLIVGADVRSEYSNIRYLHLIIGKAQKFVQVTNMISEGRNHVPAANTNLLYFTL